MTESDLPPPPPRPPEPPREAFLSSAPVSKKDKKRKKKVSLRPGRRCLTKSIVETEAREVRAELTEDMAAERMATIRNPFSK